MQAITPTPAWHLTASVLVNNDDLILLNHIIDVLLKQAVRSQELRNVVNSLRLTVAVLLTGSLLFFFLFRSHRFIQIDLGELTNEVRQYESIGIVRMEVRTPHFGEVRILVLFVDSKIQFFLQCDQVFFARVLLREKFRVI